ncbi:MAG: sigma-70 family RNA polymerase sigma factor [Chitinophagaceae bacterium]|nr:sigma-70 family RNA polymerase sigma factor [Chitinophagaceae bacterium]
MYTDEILWEGIRQGNMEMLVGLYKKYYHSLLFIGLSEIKDASTVKDAIQQQFLYIWEKRATIAQAKNVKSYLITSFLRRLHSDGEKFRKASHLTVVWNNGLDNMPLAPDDGMIQKEEQHHLYKGLIDHIDKLPARQKELILLKFYEGLTYEEIVQQTGLTHRTVYNNIHEALKKLKLDMDKKPFYRIAANSFLPLAILFLNYLANTRRID